MKQIGDFDPLESFEDRGFGQRREALRKQKIAEDREQGYQQLAELCAIAEYNAAKHLACRNSRWGYEIIDGIVVSKNS